MRSWIYARRPVAIAALTMVALQRSAAAGAPAGFVAARYVSGELPVAPPLALSGGEVFLEALVDTDGQVDSVRTLRTTPPFIDIVIGEVRGWRFTPAREGESSTGQTAARGTAVVRPVFVAAMFAPPALSGPTAGEPPQDLLVAADETPMPMATSPAAYPPRAMGDGTVLVEVTIGNLGIMTEARVMVSSPAFDSAAIAAAKSWRFLPARRSGGAVPTHAYLLFAFRQPVIGR